MQSLSETSLTHGIITCAENSRYHLVIVYKDKRKANEAINSFLSIHRSEAIPYIRNISKTSYGGRALFLNNSFIDICSFNFLNNDGLGTRAHDIFYEESIVDEMDLDNLEYFFRRFLIPYHDEPIPTFKRPPDWTDTVDTSNIDEFLNSFKVVSS